MTPWIHWLARHKEFLITALVIATAIVFLGYFGSSEQIDPSLQSLIVGTAVFLVIPVLYCKIILERPLSALGFQRGHMWAGVGGSVLAVGTAIIAFLVLWNFTPLLEDYELPVSVQEQFLFFVLYELSANAYFLFLYEVFFRGLVLLLWLRHAGLWGVMLQAALFTGIVYLSGGLTSQFIPLLIFAPFAGLIAYQSRSLWYSYGSAWLFMLIVDAMVLILR